METQTTLKMKYNNNLDVINLWLYFIIFIHTWFCCTDMLANESALVSKMWLLFRKNQQQQFKIVFFNRMDCQNKVCPENTFYFIFFFAVSTYAISLHSNVAN